MDPMNKAMNASMAHYFGSHPDVILGQETPLLAAALQEHRRQNAELYHNDIMAKIEELENAEKPERTAPKDFEVSLEDLDLPMKPSFTTNEAKASEDQSTLVPYVFSTYSNQPTPSFWGQFGRSEALQEYATRAEIMAKAEESILKAMQAQKKEVEMAAPPSPAKSEYAWDADDEYCFLDQRSASPDQSGIGWDAAGDYGFVDVLNSSANSEYAWGDESDKNGRAPSPAKSEYMWGPEVDGGNTEGSTNKDLPFYAGVSYDVDGDMVIHLVNWKTPERLRLFEKVGDLVSEFIVEHRHLLEKEEEETERSVEAKKELMEPKEENEEITQTTDEKELQEAKKTFEDMTDDELCEKIKNSMDQYMAQQEVAIAQNEMDDLSDEEKKMEYEVSLKSVQDEQEEEDSQDSWSDVSDFETVNGDESSDDDSDFESVYGGEEKKKEEEESEVNENEDEEDWPRNIRSSKVYSKSCECLFNIFYIEARKKEEEALRLEMEAENNQTAKHVMDAVVEKVVEEEKKEAEETTEDVMEAVVEKVVDVEKKKIEEKLKDMIKKQELVATTDNFDEKMKLLDEISIMMAEDWFQKL